MFNKQPVLPAIRDIYSKELNYLACFLNNRKHRYFLRQITTRKEIPMNVFTALETRRSIRQYTSNNPIPQAHFDALINAVRVSPTSFNIQHWRIVRVLDSALRHQLQEAAWGQEQITGAQELLILCGDIDAWQKKPERYWRNLETSKQNYIVNMLKDFYSSKSQLQRDEAIRSCAIAAQSLMLAANALGYDSNPMIGFDADDVGKIINLPKQHVVTMMITLGKANEAAGVRGGDIPLHELLVMNTFS